MSNVPKINQAAFTYYERLRRIKQYVDGNSFEDVSLGTVARVAGLEKKYFSAFFRLKVGIGFKDWLTYLRIGRAMELLERQDQTITAVAFAVGFRDLGTFERAFKKATGMTPQVFKKSVRPC